MASTILELIVIALKLVYTIVGSIIKWKVEERNRFEERMKTISKLLKDAVENKDESLNEDDYLSNLEWEKKERYKTYKLKSIEVLTLGGGINELEAITSMGMGVAVANKKIVIIELLQRNLSVEEKGQWIAKNLLDT